MDIFIGSPDRPVVQLCCSVFLSLRLLRSRFRATQHSLQDITDTSSESIRCMTSVTRLLNSGAHPSMSIICLLNSHVRCASSIIRPPNPDGWPLTHFFLLDPLAAPPLLVPFIGSPTLSLLLLYLLGPSFWTTSLLSISTTHALHLTGPLLLVPLSSSHLQVLLPGHSLGLSYAYLSLPSHPRWSSYAHGGRLRHVF